MRKLDISAATVWTASSHVKRRKRGSKSLVAVPADECFMVSCATVWTASSHVKRRKRGSTAVPKTSKIGEERFYIIMRSDYHSV